MQAVLFLMVFGLTITNFQLTDSAAVNNGFNDVAENGEFAQFADDDELTEKLTDEDEVHDLRKILKTFNATKVVSLDGKSANDWKRYNFNTISMFQKSSIFTDCTFIVGPDGSEQKINAHSLILAAASPLLKEVFLSMNSTSRTFRITEMEADEFQHILHFIYSGDVCVVDNYNQAVALFKHASFLGLNGIKETARSYVMSQMDADTIWKVYQVAKDAGDQTLENAVWFVIARLTVPILKTSAFNKIPQDALLKLMSQNGLTIDSEYQLYEALVKWALIQARDNDLETSPATLRQIIGDDILKQVRFSTMTSSQFAQVYMGFKILSYEETLPIMFNINDPGSVPLPDTISNSTTPRNKGVRSSFMTYRAPEFCNGTVTQSGQKDILSKSTAASIYINNGNYIRLWGVKIPMSFESRLDNSSSIEEHFDVVIMDAGGNVIHKKAFDGVANCLDCEVSGDFLITVHIDGVDMQDNFQIKVEFRDSKEYPKSLSGEYSDQITCRRGYYNYYDGGNDFDFVDQQAYYSDVDATNFIHSLIFT